MIRITTSYRNIFYWACAAILWTYMSVTIINLYKSWYITTVFVCIFTGLLLFNNNIKTNGLVKSLGLILIYYSYLLLTAIWAEYPDVTIWFVATESIYVIIFALFYLLSINFAPDRIIDFFVYLVPPAILCFLITYIIDPEASRFGGYVLVLLPFIFLFCVFRLIQSVSILNIVFITACLLMLVTGRSRAPLIIAGFGLLLMFMTKTNPWRRLRKPILVFVMIGIVFIITIITVPQLKLFAAQTIVRITYQEMVVSDQVIEAEMPDEVRWRIYDDAFLLYKTNWLFGMGYMNFMPWFGDMYNFIDENPKGKETVGMNLHNTFQTWALEGGLPCLCIVAMLLWKYFRILRRRIIQSNNDLEKSYYKLFVIGMVCSLVVGLFHQIHQTPMLFILLGIVYALEDNNKNNNVHPLP